MRRRVAAASLAVLTVLSTVGVAAAQASADHSRTGHDRVIDYWTPERMAAAQPRALELASSGLASAKGRDRVVKGVWDDPEARVAETSGKLFFLLEGDPYTCSATAVDAGEAGVDTVLTAGHCLWDRTASSPEGSFATYVLFVPGYAGGAVPVLSKTPSSYDGWVAEQLFVTPEWQQGSLGDDVGMAVVANATEPGRDFDDAFEDLPTLALPGAAVAAGRAVSAFGYPGDRNYKGSRLGYCQGPLERPAAYPGTLALRCQLSGGASGGAWYSGVAGTGDVISVNSHERRGDNRVFGPVFDAAEAGLFAAAADGACSTQEACASASALP